MSDIAIQVKGLSKRYRIGKREGYLTLKDSLARSWKNVLSSLQGTVKAQSQHTNNYIWALKDISFDIKKGEVVGIIGRNGVGKTTLLKILSRITEPTAGYAEVRGRVGSLLEVGTGFHPELTGRENIYLNGAILGMKKAEIERKFDEIVEFSEVKNFIDTPIKYYSSGMQVRLAFSVAAHLEADILLVDEVLAVGDTEFQKKCLGKIGDVAHEGRTVLFVSHNMASIVKLCGSAIWIENGRIRVMGDTEEAVQAYLASGLSTSEGRVVFHEPKKSPDAFIRSVELINKRGAIESRFDILSPIKVNILFSCKRRFLNGRIFVAVMRYDGVTVFSTTTSDYKDDQNPIEPGVYCASLLIPGRFLAEGAYLLSIAFGEVPIKRHDVHENVLHFEVVGQHFYDRWGRNIGMLAYPFEWHVDPVTEETTLKNDRE